MKIKISKIYIISAFFIGFFILSVIFIIYPLVQKIKNNSQDLVSIKEERFSNSQEIANLKNLKPILEKIEPDSKKIDTLFINPKVPIDFIKFLEELAKNCSIQMKVSSVNPVSAKKYHWQAFNFQLQVSGPYLNFSRFVEKLENSPYLTDIYNLNVRKLLNSEIISSTSLVDYVDASIYFTVFAK